MRWIDGYTFEQKRKQREEWHRWWAWFPVVAGITPNGRKIKVWLGYVDRSGSVSFVNIIFRWDYTYKECGAEGKKPASKDCGYESKYWSSK
jgi:hypothetical protein